jgi:hypothetical protein
MTDKPQRFGWFAYVKTIEAVILSDAEAKSLAIDTDGLVVRTIRGNQRARFFVGLRRSSE